MRRIFVVVARIVCFVAIAFHFISIARLPNNIYKCLHGNNSVYKCTQMRCSLHYIHDFLPDIFFYSLLSSLFNVAFVSECVCIARTAVYRSHIVDKTGQWLILCMSVRCFFYQSIFVCYARPLKCGCLLVRIESIIGVYQHIHTHVIRNDENKFKQNQQKRNKVFFFAHQN